MGHFIPLSIPNFEGNERKYVDDAISQGWVSTGGAYITKLEEMLAEYLYVENVSACQSGTSGIHLALISCGVEPGDMQSVNERVVAEHREREQHLAVLTEILSPVYARV